MRVIAGELRGRRLVAPRGRGTRPTSDRVRESMFMVLEPLAGARVIDLFAGSGALGIEACSRGAERVDFVESDPGARQALQRNLVALGLEARARVWPLRLPEGLRALRHALGEADLVFADPPYGGREAGRVLEALGAPGVLAAGVRVVLEHHAKDDVPDRAGDLERIRSRRYGETTVSTYRLGAETGPEPQEEP